MDPWKILGVDKNTTPDELKNAYRKLAAKHHPDRGGNTAKFQEIQHAYDILSDPQKRTKWEAQQNPHMRAYHGHGNPFSGPFSNFGDIFGQMFQNMQQAQRKVYTMMVHIPLEQVATGGLANVQINTGNGSKLIQVDIPQGIEDGQQIKYDNIMPDGSLIITYRIAKHEKFERYGLDLLIVAEVNIFELITGTKIIIKSIYGDNLEMNVPPMTKPGSKFRLQSKGLRSYGNVGDQYVLIQPIIPDRISSTLLSAIENEVKSNK